MQEYIQLGTIAVKPTHLLLNDLTPGNHARAEIYELYVMAMLRFVGPCTMDELYKGEVLDIPLYIAVHSLRNKGLIACPDPYGEDAPMWHTDFNILPVQGATAKWPRKKTLSPAASSVKHFMRLAFRGLQ